MIMLSALLATGACSAGFNFKELAVSIDKMDLIKFDMETGDPIKTVQINSKEEITKFFSTISRKEAPATNCKANYRLDCYKKNGELLLIQINSEEFCQSITFMLDDEVHNHIIRPKGIEMLNDFLK